MAAGSCYEYSHVASAATTGQPWVQSPRLPGKSSEDIHSLAKPVLRSAHIGLLLPWVLSYWR
jgi:hypothetical protein